MKVWITKYALTMGILEKDAERCKTQLDMIQVGTGINRQYFHGERKDWHTSRESAIRRSEEMKTAKLRSIDKQRARIAALQFS